MNLLRRSIHFSLVLGMSALRFPNPERAPNSSQDDGQCSILPQSASKDRLIGQTPVMREMCERISCVSRTAAHVLLVGEVGTEKELVAHSIHAKSAWCANSFIAPSISQLAQDQTASLLFGCVDSAEDVRGGLLAAAHGGTLFLDSLDKIPLDVQAGLVRAIDFGEVRPIGGAAALKVNVRLMGSVASTPQSAVAGGRLRRDLLERLSVCSITIPPLRDRIEDIPALAKHFLATFGVENPEKALPTSTLVSLRSRPWVENVRELRDALKHAWGKANGGPLGIELFPSPLADRVEISERMRLFVADWVREVAGKTNSEPSNMYAGLTEVVEQALLTEVLRQRRNQILPTARWLGLSRATVRKWVRKHHVFADESEE